MGQVVFDLEWRPVDGSSEATGPADEEDQVVLPVETPVRALVVNAGIAARSLAAEGVIAVPTDTLYGAHMMTRIVARCCTQSCASSIKLFVRLWTAALRFPHAGSEIANRLPRALPSRRSNDG